MSQVHIFKCVLKKVEFLLRKGGIFRKLDKKVTKYSEKNRHAHPFHSNVWTTYTPDPAMAINVNNIIDTQTITMHVS